MYFVFIEFGRDVKASPLRLMFTPAISSTNESPCLILKDKLGKSGLV